MSPTAPFLPRRLSEGSTALSRPPGIATHPTRDSRRFLFMRGNLEAGSAGGSGAHFRGVYAKAQMREVGLSERHEACVEVSPNEEQQKRHGRVVFVQDSVKHGEEEVDAEKNFRIGHPAGLVPVFLCDEGISLTFDLVFGSARELAFLADDGFDDGLRVANGNPDASGHYKRHVKEGAPPIFRAELLLRNEVETGDGAGGGEEERQIDDEHLDPALVE